MGGDDRSTVTLSYVYVVNAQFKRKRSLNGTASMVLLIFPFVQKRKGGRCRTTAALGR